MIYIQVKENTKRFLNKCLASNIDIYDIKYEKDFIIALVKEDDLERITKLNYYSKISIIRYTGLKRILINIKRRSFDLVMIFIILISLYFISNFIISINILHENRELIERINEILKSKNITKFQFKKDLGELNEISDEILQENRDILDWIAIDRKGMKYIVSFEERILTEDKEKLPYCDIVASRDGVIESITAESGVILVEKAMYVKKGDILISGTIMNNEEIKDEICAKGDVYAEVWYKVDITVPLEYEEKDYTKNKRFNFTLNGNNLFRKKYEHYDISKIIAFGPFKIVKEQEYNITTKKHGINEAKEEGLNIARKRLLESKDKKIEIISEKVLKEEVIDSKIELEVFMSVLEDIGIVSTEKVGDVSDTEQSI